MAKVTLADIAKKTGISVVTVSNALAGQKGVSDEMRAKIKKTAAEMGYRKSSRTVEKKTPGCTIGVIVAEHFLSEPQSFYWVLYQKILQEAAEKDCFAMIEVISHENENTLQMPSIIRSRKVDGIIVMGAFTKAYARMIYEKSQVPVVNLDTTDNSENSDGVVTDNVLGGYIMTNHLLNYGHRRIGFVGTLCATTSIDDRYLGYLKAMMEHGIQVKDAWLIEDRDRTSGNILYEEKFILPKDMPTAFFCNCDVTASLMIRKLNEKGYRVPEDISIVGFDNYLPDSTVPNMITTYNINTSDMAKRIVHIIRHRILNKKYSSGIIITNGSFILRGSSAKIGDPVPFF